MEFVIMHCLAFVRAENDEQVVPKQPFVPEVRIVKPSACTTTACCINPKLGRKLGQPNLVLSETDQVFFGRDFHPICGFKFWGNNEGAKLVCRALGFEDGSVQKTYKTYFKTALHVGECKAGNNLRECSAVGFSLQSDKCAQGKAIGVEVVCWDADDARTSVWPNPKL